MKALGQISTDVTQSFPGESPQLYRGTCSSYNERSPGLVRGNRIRCCGARHADLGYEVRRAQAFHPY